MTAAGGGVGTRLAATGRRFRLPLTVLALGVTVLAGWMLQVREHVAGWQLTAAVASVDDPAFARLVAHAPEVDLTALAPPTPEEIASFFLLPDVRLRTRVWHDTALDVDRPGGAALVILTVGTAERSRTEQAVELLLEGYREWRVAEVDAALAALTDEVEHLVGTLEGDAGAEARLDALRRLGEVLGSYLAESNLGVETSVLDVGGPVWQNHLDRALVAVGLGVAAALSGLLGLALVDDRVRTRHDVEAASARARVAGVVAQGDSSTLVRVVECVARELAPPDGEVADVPVVVIGDRRGREAGVSLAASVGERWHLAERAGCEACVLVVGWGDVGRDELARVVEAMVAAPSVPVVIAGVPRKEIAATAR